MYQLKKIIVLLVFGFLFFTGATVQAAEHSVAVKKSPEPVFGIVRPDLNCESLLALKLSNANIVETEIVEATEEVPAWCKVTAVIKRSETDDPISVWVGLPVNNWNGRFMGAGGGGYSLGHPLLLIEPIASGFSVATTDGGSRINFPNRNLKNGEFALDPSG